MSALVIQTGESFPINTVPVVRNQALGPGVVGAIGSTFALLGIIPLLNLLSNQASDSPVCTTCPTPPATCIPQPTCPNGFMKLSTSAGTEILNKCYSFPAEKNPFVKSIGVCNSIGGVLANFDTGDEANAVQTYLKINRFGQAHYVGYTDYNFDQNLYALSGGPLIVPGVFDLTGIMPLMPIDPDCIIVGVDANGPAVTVSDCVQGLLPICEIDISQQKCLCP